MRNGARLLKASPRLCCFMQWSNSLLTDRMPSTLLKMALMAVDGRSPLSLMGLRNNYKKYLCRVLTPFVAIKRRTTLPKLTVTIVLSCEMYASSVSKISLTTFCLLLVRVSASVRDRGGRCGVNYLKSVSPSFRCE